MCKRENEERRDPWEPHRDPMICRPRKIMISNLHTRPTWFGDLMNKGALPPHSWLTQEHLNHSDGSIRGANKNTRFGSPVRCSKSVVSFRRSLEKSRAGQTEVCIKVTTTDPASRRTFTFSIGGPETFSITPEWPS